MTRHWTWTALMVGWLVFEAGRLWAQEPCPPQPVSWPPCPPVMPAPNCCPEPCPEEPVSSCPCHVSFEGLRLRLKPQRLPPLITSGDIDDPIPGALGQPGTRVVFGNGDVGEEGHFAGRVSVTCWLTEEPCLGLEGSFLMTESRSALSDFSSAGGAGSPLLARPFFNTFFGVQDSDPRTFPFILAGSLHDAVSSQLWGAETNLRLNFCAPREAGPTMALVLGPRYLNLKESYSNLDMVENLPSGTGNTFLFSDNFQTRNEFFGGQVGGVIGYRDVGLIVELGAKFALGQNHQNVDISGISRVTDQFGNVFFDDRGFYAQAVGSHSRRTSALLSEYSVTIKGGLGERIWITAGYSLLTLNHVLRPGDQINTNLAIISVPAPPGSPEPSFSFGRESNFWVHGYSVGLEIVF